jgi:hypothetical protein
MFDKRLRCRQKQSLFRYSPLSRIGHVAEQFDRVSLDYHQIGQIGAEAFFGVFASGLDLAPLLSRFDAPTKAYLHDFMK